MWLAFWAGADKALPMLYGVAMVVITLRILREEQSAIWAIFQTIFMVISLMADFFVLQPMVKISAERDDDPRPIITASSVLYTGFSLGLALLVVALAPVVAHLLKQPGSAEAFTWMGWLVLSTVVRNIAIRILQVHYRIIAIFVVDLAYFATLIGLMIHGMIDGTFDTATDLIDYNLISFGLSSLVGVIYCFRLLRPTFRGFSESTRRVLDLGIHQGGTGVLTVAQQQIDILIVSGMRGALASSTFFAAKTFYRFFDAIRDAAQLLLVPATSRAYSQERIEAVEEVTELATAAMVVLLVPLSIVLIVAAPIIVPIVIPKFPEAVDEFQWLMASGFAMPFVIVPSAVLLGIGHTRDLFRGTLLGTVALVLGGLALTWFFGAAGMAAGVFIGTVVTAIFLTQRMNRYVPFTFRTVLRRSRSFGPMLRRRLKALELGGGRKGPGKE
jgi:O-antigen/teichoic acid export membrane protein